MDTAEKLNAVTSHYLKDQLSETDKRIILVGERGETDIVKKNIGPGLVLDVFYRPLQTEALLEVIRSHLSGSRSAAAKPSILIVDDDATYLGVIRDWLRD